MKTAPQSNPVINNPFKKNVYAILGITFLLIVILGIWFYANRFKQLTPISTPQKITSQSPLVPIPLNTSQGTIESVTTQNITVKSTNETKTFALSSDLSIQKIASTSAVNTMSPPKNLTLSEIKKGDKVTLLLDKNTNQVKTILVGI